MSFEEPGVFFEDINTRSWNLAKSLVTKNPSYEIVQVEFCTKCRSAAILVDCNVIEGSDMPCTGFIHVVYLN